MPAMLTHDQFGQDAYGMALEVTDLFTPDERDAFLLGNQGPDPLFYLLLLPPLEEFRVWGSRMHNERPSAVFCAMRQAVDGLPAEERKVGRAYLAGFTCHYLLDRAIHPLVYFWERGICQAGVSDLDLSDGNIVHAEIERDLDEMVLFTKRNQTIKSYRPYEQVLRGRDQTLAVLGDLYRDSAIGPFAEDEPTLNEVYPLAVYCFRLAQRMFWSPRGHKAKALARIEAPMLKKRYSLVRAMSHRVRAELTSDFDNRERKPWRNPFTGEILNSSFWDLYEGALGEVPGALQVVLGNEFDSDAAAELTGGLNFSGERVE